MEKFLILGGDSTLAGYFLESYGKHCIALSKKQCDITDIKVLDRIIKKSKCKYVINCAAVTDIQYSENNPKECFEVNSTAVYNIGKLCDKYGKRLIHFSSDYAIKPVNVYGYSKLVSENVINLKKNLIVRTSFYSPNYYIIKSLLAGRSTNAYKNVFFNPVSVNLLVTEVFKNKDKCGLINVFSEKRISKYNFGRMIVKYFDIDKKLLKPAIFTNKANEVALPLDSFVKSDIKISLDQDLFFFKESSNFTLCH